LWTAFVSNGKLADTFFQSHRTFLMPLKSGTIQKLWKHRLFLIEVFTCLVRDVLPTRNDISALSLSFLDLAIPVLQSAPSCQPFQ
jgi:hypothetical protein